MLAWQIAIRYIRGKRMANAVPILSRISMAAIAVGAGALIILLSVFNGFEDLVKDLYKAFYPEIKISVARGKFFSLPDSQLGAVRQVNGIKAITKVLEDNVLVMRDQDQEVATVKGVDTNYVKVNNVLPYIDQGAYALKGDTPNAVIGEHLADILGADVSNAFAKVTLFYLNDLSTNPLNDLGSATQTLTLQPAGIFHVQDEFDSKYILAPISLVQGLFQQPGKYSSVEISLYKNADPNKIKKALQNLLGSGYKIETRYEQNQTLYTVMVTEKWAIYALLLLVLIIASFNMIGALSLLVLEKRRDVAILKAMGITRGATRAIFVFEGILWALLGGGTGLLAGTLICIGQHYFKWVKLQGSFLIEAYPVHFRVSDFLLVIATVTVVGLLASLYPALQSTHTEDPSLKST